VPQLATYFDVTTDELLGMSAVRDEKRVEYVKAETERLSLENHADNREKIVELWRELAHDMPHNYEVQYFYVSQIKFNETPVFIYKDASDDQHLIFEYAERQHEHYHKVIAMLEDILAHCTDDKIRIYTIGSICDCYNQLGEPEKAHEYAERLPEVNSSREWMNEQIVIYEQMREQSVRTQRFAETGDEAVMKIDKARAEELIQPHRDALRAYLLRAYDAWTSMTNHMKEYGLIDSAEYIRMLELEMELEDVMAWGIQNRHFNVYRKLASAYREIDYETAIDYIVKEIDEYASTTPDMITTVYSNVIDEDGNSTFEKRDVPLREMWLESLSVDFTFDAYRNDPRVVAAMERLRGK
jgi:tetratricopeptide (TPR) repeat protein